MKDTKGIVLVMNPDVKGQEKDLESWAKNFVGPLKLKDTQVVIFTHQSQLNGVAKPKIKMPKMLSKIQVVETQLDVSPNLKTEFDNFLAQLHDGDSE
mmetsp:Transcript_7356/g.19084  ORF Transcript_7356/g.19084 Transcript_7356/m.19084 type:complete len:97 (-) Transcript_7356:407-697(-)